MTDLQELLDRGRELAAQQRLDDADMVFSQVLEVDADNLEAMRFKGSRALGAGAFDEAESWMRRFIDRDDANDEAWYLLGMALQRQGRFDDAIAAIERSLSIDGRVVRAWLVHGAIRQEQGRVDAAVASYLRALRTAEDLGLVATDPMMRLAMAQASKFVIGYLDRAISDGLEPLVDRHGADAFVRIRKAADGYLGRVDLERAHPMWRPGMLYVPDLEPRMFFERADFPWADAVEAATADVRAEMLTVLESGEGLAPYVDHEPGSREAETWRSINRSKNWSSFHLFRHGRRIEENCDRCPRTTALVESLDLHRIAGFGPEVMFSVLRPHTRIPPHHGPVNGRVVVHLPLVVPANCGALRVGDQERAWEEGKLLAFDDAFRHEAWNDSDETRVVLIFDCWNPQLSAAERAAFAVVLQAAQRLQRAAFDTPFSPDRLARG